MPHARRCFLPVVSRCRGGRAAGFTLIEILAVILLIALAVTAISISLGTGLAGVRAKAVSRDLAAALRYTRGQAIVQREQLAMEIDVEGRGYQAPGRPRVQLPDGMELSLLTAREELIDEGSGRIRFFPDGSSTGGRVGVVRGNREWQIEVQWLTGEVKLLETTAQ